jgi:hypothetical protein
MKEWEILNKETNKYEKWEFICRNCLSVMDVKEIMPYSLFRKAHMEIDKSPFEEHPIPHLDSSHTCQECGAIWELIENLSESQTFVCSRNWNQVFLLGKPRFSKKNLKLYVAKLVQANHEWSKMWTDKNLELEQLKEKIKKEFNIDK